MSHRFVLPQQREFDASGGNSLGGAKLTFFASGTNTPQDTFSDSARTIPHANPVVANSAGRWRSIFLSPLNYKVILDDKNGIQIYSEDPVSAGSAFFLVDADGDTRVDVELSPDEDIIRFTTLGVLRALIDASGLTLSAGRSIGAADDTVRFDIATKETLALVAGILALTDFSALNTAGPTLDLDRNGGAGTALDFLGNIAFNGRSSADVERVFAEIASQIITATNGAEDGRAILRAMVAGVLTDELLIGSGLVVGPATGGAQGVGTVNATRLFENGVATIFTPRGHIDGMITSNSPADVTNDIDIDPGITIAEGGAGEPELLATLTKQLDEIWAVGSGAGGLGTDALIVANTTVSFDNATSKILGTGLFGGYAAQDKIIIVGSVANSGPFQVTAATANDVTVSPAPTSEAAGPAITAYVVKKNTWYHVWMIRRSDTQVTDAMFHPDVTAPSLPTGYDQARMIMSVRTTATSGITAYIQNDDHVSWLDPPLDVTTGVQGPTAVSRALSVPEGISVLAELQASTLDTSFRANIYLRYPAVNNEAQSDTLAPLATFSSPSLTEYGHWRGFIRTNTVRQITSVSPNSNTNLHIATMGFIHPRGRNA